MIKSILTELKKGHNIVLAQSTRTLLKREFDNRWKTPEGQEAARKVAKLIQGHTIMGGVVAYGQIEAWAIRDLTPQGFDTEDGFTLYLGFFSNVLWWFEKNKFPEHQSNLSSMYFSAYKLWKRTPRMERQARDLTWPMAQLVVDFMQNVGATATPRSRISKARGRMGSPLG